MKNTYKQALKNALKEANKTDNYIWKALSFDENEAKFTWSYLSEKDEPFTLTIENGFILVKIPYTNTTCGVLVGEKPWHDAHTIEEGIALVVKGAVQTANNLF